jgi:hypothetical protein
VGCTIVFSVCNKPFKPPGISSERVKSSEGFTGMIPTNIVQNHVIHKIEVSLKQWFSFISKLNIAPGNYVFDLLGPFWESVTWKQQSRFSQYGQRTNVKTGSSVKPRICLACVLPCITVIHPDVCHINLEGIFSQNTRRGLCNQVLDGVQKETLSFIRWLLEGTEDVQFDLYILKPDLHNSGPIVYVCISHS